MEKTRSFIIIKTNEITDPMLKESLNEKGNYLKSIDKKLSILKFGTNNPATTIGHDKLTLEEIKTYRKNNPGIWVPKEE